MKMGQPVMVLRTSDLEKTRMLYAALGLTLVEEVHAGCPPHYSCDLGALLIEFYPLGAKSPALKAGNDTTFFFDTDLFDALLTLARQLDLKRGPVTIYDKELGRRLVTIHDPDGRPVRVRELAKKAPD